MQGARRCRYRPGLSYPPAYLFLKKPFAPAPWHRVGEDTGDPPPADAAVRAAIDDCVFRAGTAARPNLAGGDAHGRESIDEDPAKFCSASDGRVPRSDNRIRTD